jgi:hypothetical protein
VTPLIPVTRKQISITGQTDYKGVFDFTFTAADPAGEHTITASCTDSTCVQKGPTKVWVMIPNLVALPPNPSLFVLRGERNEHPWNHFFTVAAYAVIIDFAEKFREKYNGQLLMLNDSSLPNGGVYDIHKDWANPHKGHRKGIVVDINNFGSQNVKFESWAQDQGVTPVWEDDPPHYHVRLLGKDG